MTDRTLALTVAINEKLAKNKKIREKKKKKREETKPVKELHAEWVVAMRGHFGVTQVPEWTGAEYSLAKKLVSDVGFEKAAKIINYYVNTWRKRRTSAQERRNELPNMKICWSLRSRLLAELEGAVSCPKSKRERILKGEYNPVLASAAPSRGWGD